MWLTIKLTKQYTGKPVSLVHYSYCYIMYLVNSLRLQKVTKLVTLLVFMKSLCACQFSKFSKAVNSYNIASISKNSANY